MKFIKEFPGIGEVSCGFGSVFVFVFVKSFPSDPIDYSTVILAAAVNFAVDDFGNFEFDVAVNFDRRGRGLNTIRNGVWGMWF